MPSRKKPSDRPLHIAGQLIEPGNTYNLQLDYSQSYTGIRIPVPVRVVAGPDPGPKVFLTAVVHGDEINGLGIVREVMFEKPLKLRRGVVVAVPAVNVLGMESHSRYLPDRRDLNRCFPGTSKGSLSSRLANLIYRDIVRHCDYGIDLHSAAVRRTNYPNIRADLDRPEVAKLARAFGCELIVHSKAARGSLRRVAVGKGIPTIVLEAGEVWKIEPGVTMIGARGVRNILRKLRMLEGQIDKPACQIEVRSSIWVRAERGGILNFHALPGDLVRRGQCIATNLTIFGEEQNAVIAPADGIILGMTTMPAVKPGEPIFHLALIRQSHSRLKQRMKKRSATALHRIVQQELATNLLIKKRRGKR